jgi:hypothetical protein
MPSYLIDITNMDNGRLRYLKVEEPDPRIHLDCWRDIVSKYELRSEVDVYQRKTYECPACGRTRTCIDIIEGVRAAIARVERERKDNVK